MASVERTRVGSVAVVALARPEVRNALDAAARAELLAALEEAAADLEVRAVLLTGRGGAFSAGEDVRALSASGESVGDVLRRGYHRILGRLLHMPKPTLALVDGVAAGAGLSLALACDLRLATEGARFQAAFAGIGLVPDAGLAYLLPRMVGLSRALLMTVRGDPLTAEEARAQGLVFKVVPSEGAEEAALAEAARLAAGPTAALAWTRAAMLAAFDLRLPEFLELEAALQERAQAGEDHREGLAAFFEKRRPTFQGR